MENCLACMEQQGQAPIPGGICYEDDLVFAKHIYNNDGPTYLGYALAQTKRHAPSFEDLTDAEAQAIGLLVARLSWALRACIGAEHIYLFKMGHHMSHLHVHVVGRYPGAPQEYWGVHVDEWPDAPHGGAAEIAALAERLRAYLSGG
jgi:histidine triad (HIT) family protein